MSEHDRGAYTPPTEGGLSFDARQPVRGARPVPFTLIISVLVLAALVAAIFIFYQQGVRGSGEAPQVVGESVGGMRSVAPPEAQPQDPAAGLEIYRPDATDPTTAAPNFTPPPEQPQARTPATPVVVQPPAAPPAAAPAQPALRDTVPAPTPTAPPANKAPPVTVKPAPAPPPPAVKAQAPAPKAAEPKPPEPKAAPAPAKGGVSVQIGAVASTELAEKTWTDAIKASGGLGSGKGKAIEKVERDGKTLYRTGVTGFASRADAAAFCAKLQAAGKACFIR